MSGRPPCPAPGGPDQLRAVAAKLFARPLDRHRPLWEEWFLDGLEGGRWAILSRIHHCMVDGVGGNDLMTLVFDMDPDTRPPAVASGVPALRPSLAAQAADDLRDAIAGPLRQLAAAPGLLRRAKAGDLMERQPRPGRERAALGRTVREIPQRPHRPAPQLGLDHGEPERAEADPRDPRRHHQRHRARRDHRSLPRPADSAPRANRGNGRTEPGPGICPRPGRGSARSPTGCRRCWPTCPPASRIRSGGSA